MTLTRYATVFAASLTVMIALLGRQPVAAETVTIGGFIPAGSIAARMFEDYGQTLATSSGGRLEPALLIHGEGGSEEQILSGIRRQRFQVAAISTLTLSSLIPEMGYLGTPYLFENKEQFDYVVDTHLIEILEPLLAEKGLTMLRWIDAGSQNVYANTPILLPEQAEGMRLRTTQDLAARLFLQAIEADVIYLPSPETMMALQTGMIDGGVNPVLSYAGTSLMTDAPHFILTEHFYVGVPLLANSRWLRRLPSDLRDLVTEGFWTNAEIRSGLATMINEALGQAEAQNFTVHRLTETQRAAWQAHASGIAEGLVSQLGGQTADIAAQLEQAKQAFSDD